ncbi:MAG: acyl carrier protein [Bacteroidaceae bacterium]|nr:acyl carrier protein [Bacteroidaceae bacterium]
MEIKEFIEKFEDVFVDTDMSTLEPNTLFRELDEWTSMTALATMAMVSDEYDVELTADEMRHANTFQDLFDTVKSHL